MHPVPSAFTYPVYKPDLSGNEKAYVNECLESSWISSKGRFIGAFEASFADWTGIPHATSVCNGTVALHLALLALGIGPGDEVIVPTLTYVASVNTIVQAGAVPVFVDSDPHTWNMDPARLAACLSPRTRAVMAVHLYGLGCDMAAISRFCAEHSLLLIEDCAEAIGATVDGRHVGAFGDVATFSFFGNKTITTGEGGMVASRHKSVVERAYLLKTQGVSPQRSYWHDELGFNYRMTNICAAIGLAQMERVDATLHRKRDIARWYQDELRDTGLQFQPEPAGYLHSQWMCSVLVPASAEGESEGGGEGGDRRDALRAALADQGIETRPFFVPAHRLPHLRRPGSWPVADALSRRGINLPSYPALTRDDVARIAHCLRSHVCAHA